MANQNDIKIKAQGQLKKIILDLLTLFFIKWHRKTFHRFYGNRNVLKTKLNTTKVERSIIVREQCQLVIFSFVNMWKDKTIHINILTGLFLFCIIFVFLLLQMVSPSLEFFTNFYINTVIQKLFLIRSVLIILLRA